MNGGKIHIMDNFKYLKIDIQHAFARLEELIGKGYSKYVEIQEIIKNGSFQDQVAPPTAEKLLEMRQIVNNWVSESCAELIELYVSTNYANEFMIANHSSGFRVSTGDISTLTQNIIGYIRKLEEYRNSLLNKSNLTINNSGYLNVQIGDNNSNEQTE